MSPKVILITGANSGVGFATSKVVAGASPDFHVIMSGRNLEKVEAAKTEIEAAGGVKGQLSTLHLDITDDASIESAVTYIGEHFGQLDALVNNAAVGGITPNHRERLRYCMETNVVSTRTLSLAMQPLLLKSDNPYSIYVSSGVGSLKMAADAPAGATGYLVVGDAYRSSKAAVNMIMILEHKDTYDTQLKVFAVCPGFVVSNLRGTSEEARTGGGKAGDPMVSGQTILSIVEGKRDADVGKLVHKDGVYPW
ncbi:short chain dehydrogenase/reductase [Rhizodiscina lignyota]|uniref:Short chain dehydrogenase/reductase n=1 Tax=Rhizodiscina lignyota TaxID=1504668 RepID=A0A9P4I9M9_9PEZI|nr:short chain dehydrogenase/reductase [Rhizodiscina lignyota]